ncbi:MULTISPECIES: phage tail tape measure protein [unclassified Microbacterium]|uniref:phage tail tape measure protein n=1 Tax=unclassified Microbacterium TaxID=2609290 RepID=UPI001604E801|nr:MULTISPECIES: phage tail tape measure protein [unclassified Microbacterium]QNA92699.1 phage tail tape measure protein [Microbacterium sp. Se63.02b]QYM62833.1 phage tail tape measure protein [Microbacterium sp. Se5.02b]
MPDRIVKVRLSAVVSDYEKSMRDAANATATVGTEAEKLAQKKQAFQQLGSTGLVMGTLLTAGLTLAAKASADFDAQMSNVQASTHESAANMDLLRQAALDAGEATVFSATESAQAIEEMAKAGVSTADILGGGLTGALDLAAAGGLDVATAAGIAATALKQFNLNGSEMSHVADLLAAGAGKAMGDVTDLSQALNQSALVAKQTGLSIEETTAGLSAFAAQGLLGSDAGTSFKSMLQSLNPTSAQAAELMERYNLQAYDAQGNFVGLAEYAGKLKAGLSGLSTEQQNATLKTIFGADAVRAATVLYQQGSEGITEWTQAVDDQGYAASTAAMRLDNLKGDVEALGGAFETALIDTGSTANDTLRTMVQALTGLIGMYNDLPAPVQGTVMALGGAAAAVALTGGAAFLAIPKWLEFKATVEASTWTMKGIGFAAGGAALALGGLFMIVGELAAKHQQAQQRAQQYADAIEDGTNKLTEAARATAIDELQKGGELLTFNWQSAYDAAEKLGVGADVVTDAALKNADAIDQLSTYYAALSGDQEAFNKIQGDTGMNAYETRLALEAMIGGIQEQNAAIDDGLRLKGQEEKANSAATAQSQSAAGAYIEQADAIQDLNSQLTSLIDRINAANGVAVDAITANANYLSAMDGLKGQAEKLGLSLDESTVSGSANAAAMGEIAEKARAAAEAQLQQDVTTMSADESAKKYAATLASQRQAFIDSAVSAGYNANQVKALADRIFQMPTEKEFHALVETATAQSQIDRFVTLNNGRRVKVFVDAQGGQSFRVGSTTVAPGMSTGGPVRGPGPKGKDSELRMLAPGEHVLTADEVDAAGGHSAIGEWRALLTGARSDYALTADSPEHVMEIPSAMIGRWEGGRS